MNAVNCFRLSLSEVQPSQLYINAAKLSQVLSLYPRQRLQEVRFPVLQIDSRLVFSDQHTRALAAWMHGLDQIIVYPEQDQVSLEMYRICVQWCHSENIQAIQHLAQRVIDDREYQTLWIERCKQMHRALSNPNSQDSRCCDYQTD
jgi:hypothetical protein